MAQETAGTTVARTPSGAALAAARATGPLPRDPKTGRLMPRASVRAELPVDTETEEQDLHDEAAVAVLEYAADVEVLEPEHSEITDDPEADQEELTELEQRALGQQRAALVRVKALLEEALRLGVDYKLIEKHPDGTLVLAGQDRPGRRDSSDCACAQCTPWAQQHWWCVVCSSGPHDWQMVKPQYERQTLKPGGIEGARQAACSAQCARDFLSSLGRQPSGAPIGRGIDPTLGLPG